MAPPLLRLGTRGSTLALTGNTLTPALAALKCTIWGDVPLVSRAELEELLATDSTEIRR